MEERKPALYKYLTDVIADKYEHLDITNPDMADCISFLEIDLLKSSFVNDAVNALLTKNNLNRDTIDRLTLVKIEHLFEEYNTIKHHLLVLMNERDSSVGLSADEPRYLSALYLKFLLGEKLPELRIDEKKYYEPSFGTTDQWMTYIDSLFYLNRTEEIDKFVEARKVLLETRI